MREAPAAPEGPAAGQSPASAPAGDTPFDRQGMWVWYVDQADGGSAPAIVAAAKRAGIGTLYVKAGDGGTVWSQFSPGLVEALHRGGLDVCAWQFVYGDNPVAEARVGATAVRRGADCLAIDAEGQYEGKYAAADRYVRALRARIGAALPLSLAGFPYVDYHPAFPYSVFLGPEGATANQPQMYWKAIGTSVRTVYEHTYTFNRLWGRPIYPLGQTYGGPARADLVRFRRFAESYGGAPPSWWDWQETSGAGWGALGWRLAGPVFGYRPVEAQPLLKLGSRGDLVVWAQEHLAAAGTPGLPVTGIFGKRTRAAVRAFQASRGLPASGAIGDKTWSALLAVEPARPRWAAARRNTKRGRGGASGGGGTKGHSGRSRGGATVSGSRRGAATASRPLSASLPPKADEIPAIPRP